MRNPVTPVNPLRNTVSPMRAIVAGFVACLCMLALLFALPMLGAPRINVFALLSTLSPGYNWWIQPVEYFALGAVLFPLLYAVMMYDNLPGKRPWQKGLAWGLILFALRGLVVAPIMGQGLLPALTRHAYGAVLEVLVAHVLYGLVLGSLAGQRPEERPALQRQLQNERQAATRR